MSISDIEANWELKWYFTKFKETKAIHTTLKPLLSPWSKLPHLKDWSQGQSVVLNCNDEFTEI